MDRQNSNLYLRPKWISYHLLSTGEEVGIIHNSRCVGKPGERVVGYVESLLIGDRRSGFRALELAADHSRRSTFRLSQLAF